MIHKNRPAHAVLLAALLCGVSGVSLLAQGPGGPPAGGPEHHRHGLPPNALFDALDTNHDGVISAQEIANASASLKALLKDGATELKREDLRPTPPRPDSPEDASARGGEHPRDGMPAVRPHGPPPADDARPEAADRPEADAGMPPVDGPEHARRHGPPPEVDQAHGEAPAAPEPRREADARPGGPQTDGPEHARRHGPPPSPIFDALDTNHDGVISEDEMKDAPASLRGLLKSGTSELRREDLRPMHPPHHPEN